MLKNWTLRLASIFQFIGSEVYSIVDKTFPLPFILKEGYVWFHGRDPSQHRQRSLDSSRPGRLGSKLIVAYLTPFLIIRKIGCPFPLCLRGRKASLTVDRVQQGEPSLFGSSPAQCQCGTLPFLVPIGVTLFTGRPHGSKKKRRSCSILW